MILMPKPRIMTDKVLAKAAMYRALGYNNAEIDKILNIGEVTLHFALKRLRARAAQDGVDGTFIWLLRHMETRTSRSTLVALLMDEICGHGKGRNPDVKHRVQRKEELSR